MFWKMNVALAVVAIATTAAALAADNEDRAGHIAKASETIGLDVINLQNEDLGEVNDLIVGTGGDRVTHMLVSEGGVLGVGATLRALPLEAVELRKRVDSDRTPADRTATDRTATDRTAEARRDAEWVVVIDITRERFEQAPTFESDNLTALGQQQRINQLDEYYKVERRADRQDGHVYRASDLTGLNIRHRNSDDDVGTLEEIVFESRSGEIRYGALSFGGFLGFGDKLFAIPWESLQPVQPADEDEIQHLTLLVEVSEERLREAEGFSKDNWPSAADERFLADRADRPAQVGEREDEIRR